MNRETMRIGVLCCVALLLSTGAALAGKKQIKHKAVVTAVGKSLVNAAGKAVSYKGLLKTDHLLLYFSAHWCPPCRAFTPKLVEFYNKHAKDNNLEIIFVSSDRSKKDMLGYMTEMKMAWPAVNFKAIKKSGLKAKYAGAGIPCLVLLNASDEVVSDSYIGKKYVGPHRVLKDLEALLNADDDAGEARE